MIYTGLLSLLLAEFAANQKCSALFCRFNIPVFYRCYTSLRPNARIGISLPFCFDAILLLVIGVIMFTWNLWQCVIVVSFVNDLLLINNWWICYNGSCKSLQYRGTCIRLRVSAMKPSSRLWISCGMWNAEGKMRNDGDWSTCHTTWPQLLRSYRNPRVAGAVVNCVMQMWKVALCACYFNLPNMFIWKLSRNDMLRLDFIANPALQVL